MKRTKAYKTVAEGQRLMVIPMVVWSVVFTPGAGLLQCLFRNRRIHAGCFCYGLLL